MLKRSMTCVLGLALFTAAARAEDICGVTADDATSMIVKVEALGLEKAPSPDNYASVQDAANRILWTMTAPGHPAHPSAVCRKVVQVERSMTIEMRLLCDAAQEACDALVSEFQIMNELMRRNLQPR